MEQNDFSIRINPHQCKGCYRCVRACGAQAIVVKGDRISIAQDECIRCGSCRKACPHGMIELRNDVAAVRRMLKTSDTVYASLDPNWVGDFSGISSQRIIEALTLLGFSGVSETLLGHKKYDEAVTEQLQRNPRLGISTRCPVVVRLVRHHYPELADKLLPIAHPATLHARMIRHWKGSATKVVYITPCFAAKSNPDEISELDGVITFGELKQWLREDGIQFDLIPGSGSYRFEPGESDHSAYKITTHTLNYNGLPVVREILEQLGSNTTLKTGQESVLLELLGCTGGCAGAEEHAYAIGKELAIRHYYNERKVENPLCKLPFIPTVATYPASPAERFQVSAAQVEGALTAIGKSTERDMLNCSGCGYETCRDFGRALCLGRAEPEMCLSYTRSLAQKKFRALLTRIPSGMMLADADLRIVETNRNMAQLLGPQAEQLFDNHPGMRGVELGKLIPFSTLLQQVLDSGVEMAEQDIRLKGKMLHLSVFTVEPHKLIGIMASSLVINGVQSDEMIRQTRKVIRENLETVQQIACLLGENAARTEAVLNSIVTATDHEERS